MSSGVSPAADPIERDPDPPFLSEIRSLVTRNDRHQDRLSEIDVRISVSGTRGKSTLARWLHDELLEREFDTYAKITGREPLSVYNGTEWVVPRGERVTLYENEREIRRFYPMDAIVIENQGITPYTTRLVNTRYVDPTLVVVPNIREDHLDTLGGDREVITRSIARSIPPGTHVICGEQGEAIRRYFAKELDQRDAEVTFVDVPTEFARIPGAELVYCLDETLRTVDGTGLDRDRTEAYLEEFHVAWRHLPDGRIFDAASVNDVQSTEAIRRALVTDTDDEVVQPLIYLRRDRPGRTASYARYVDELAEKGLVEQVRVVNGHATAFDARTDVDVVIHESAEEPASVLASAFADDWPVLVMGNANPPFMQRLRTVLDDLEDDEGEAPALRRLETATLNEIASDASQILVLDRQPRGTTNGVCDELLTLESTDAALIVAMERSVDDHLDEWAGRSAAESPDQLGIIAIGDPARSASATTPASPSARLPQAGSIGPIIAIEDVRRLGTALAQALDELGAADETISVCFNSIDQLVVDRSLEDAFRIIHVISRQLESAGAVGHFHLSTDGQNGHTVATLKPLFDAIITINEDGDRWIHD